MSVEALDAVHKSVVVPVPPERAFAVFTERTGEWWPLASHSIHRDAAATAVFEGREGGRVYERTSGGQEASWGRIVAWEPPHRLLFTWEVTDAPTEVEVTFSPDGEAGTRVELVHRGWEALGDAGAGVRADYDGGWDFVLGRYLESA